MMQIRCVDLIARVTPTTTANNDHYPSTRNMQFALHQRVLCCVGACFLLVLVARYSQLPTTPVPFRMKKAKAKTMQCRHPTFLGSQLSTLVLISDRWKEVAACSRSTPTTKPKKKNNQKYKRSINKIAPKTPDTRMLIADFFCYDRLPRTIRKAAGAVSVWAALISYRDVGGGGGGGDRRRRRTTKIMPRREVRFVQLFVPSGNHNLNHTASTEPHRIASHRIA